VGYGSIQIIDLRNIGWDAVTHSRPMIVVVATILLNSTFPVSFQVFHQGFQTDAVSGSEHTIMSFDDVEIGYVGESFRFSEVSYFHVRVFPANTDARGLVRVEERICARQVALLSRPNE
jgi:hypothetical protein